MRSLSFSALFNVMLLSLCVVLTGPIVFAWTGPSAAPPNGNVPAPVNVGSVNQVKNGGLSLNSLAVFGNTLISGDPVTYLNFGSTPLASGYGFRDNSGTMEYKNSGGAWTAMPSGDSGYSSSLGINGWRKSPDGWIEQWGYVAGPFSGKGDNVPVTLPIPFPNAMLSVNVTNAHPGTSIDESDTSRDWEVEVRSMSKTGILFFTNKGYNSGTNYDLPGFYWFARGY